MKSFLNVALARAGFVLMRQETFNRHQQQHALALAEKSKAHRAEVESLDTQLAKVRRHRGYLEKNLDFHFWSGNSSYIYEDLIPRIETAKDSILPGSMNQTFTKKVSERARPSPYSFSMQFFVELDCLSRLNALDWPEGERKPLPSLVDYDPKTLTITMSHCGTSLNALTSTVMIPDVEGQAQEIVRALESANIVHHDISPGNLCVSAKGELSIIDFGHAKVLDWPLGPVTHGTICTEEAILRICEKSPHVVFT